MFHTRFVRNGLVGVEERSGIVGQVFGRYVQTLGVGEAEHAER